VENPVEKAGEMWKTSVVMSCVTGFPQIFELQQPFRRSNFLLLWRKFFVSRETNGNRLIFSCFFHVHGV
jgi:hypothetical protein